MDQPTHENHKNIGTPRIKVISQSRVIGFKCYKKWGAIVFNATFSNISVLLWQPVLLVEESRVHRENHRPVASHWQT
jgi:hypothetical protein